MKIEQVETTPGLRELPGLVIRELIDRARLLVDAIRGIEAETEPLEELFPSEPVVATRLKARRG